MLVKFHAGLFVSLGTEDELLFKLCDVSKAEKMCSLFPVWSGVRKLSKGKKKR